MLFVTTAWAWSCLAIKLASLVRTTIITNATAAEIFSGKFLEAAVWALYAVYAFHLCTP